VYNPPAGTVFNSGSYTLSVSFTPTDSVNYASASASATQKVADVTKLVMFAAPAAGTSGTGAWQVSAGAADADGDLLVSAPITITTTDGDISPAQGLTDQTGVLTATLMAPSSYSGQTVAVSATNGKVSSAVNIDFTALPNSASAAVRNRLRAASVNLNGMSSSDTTSGISVTPLIVASSIESGTDNPFSVPDPCFIQSALSTVPVACQSVFSQKNLQYKNSELSKVVCSASDALNNIAGVSSCAGTTAVILGCALTVSGVGAPIGAGVCTVGLANPEGLTAATTECASWILGNLAKTPNPNDKLTYDMSALPAGSDPPSITDLIGVKCDELDVQGKLSDAQISVLPETVTLALGGHNQFGAATVAVSGLTWSVNGVTGGDSTNGLVSSSGFFKAPSSFPEFAPCLIVSHSIPCTITVTATSNENSNIYATAIVNLVDPAGNPSPTIYSLSPSTLPAGSKSQSLVIKGVNLLPTSWVSFNGEEHDAIVNGDTITIELTSNELATKGDYIVAVTNPGPGGGISNYTFTVTGTVAPTTHTLSIIVKNVVSGNIPLTGKGQVNLMDSTGALVVGTQFTDQNQQVQFANLSAGSYSYKVYNQGANNIGEYWGSGTATISGSDVAVTFNRSMPYISSVKFSAGNNSLTNSSNIALGTAVHALMLVTNPGQGTGIVGAALDLDHATIPSTPNCTTAAVGGVSSVSLSCDFIVSADGMYHFIAALVDGDNTTDTLADTVAFSVGTTNVPSPPSGLLPGNASYPGETVTSLAPTLSWNASLGATQYQVVVIKVSTNTTVCTNTSKTTSTACPTFENGATYVWSVSASNASDTSVPSSGVYFTVNAATNLPAPTISLSAGSLSFTGTSGSSNPGSQTVSISNSGTRTLNWTASVTSGASWLSVSPQSGMAPSTITASVNIVGLAAGVYNGNIAVAATGATNTPQNIIVALTLSSPPGQKPTATTGAATNPTATSATLNSTVSSNGADTTEYYQYGTTTGYGSTSGTQDIGAAPSPVSFPFTINNLTCNTVYHFRIVAQNSYGTTNGTDVSFNTAVCPTPPPPSIDHIYPLTMTASTTALTTLYVYGYNFSTSGGQLQFLDPNNVQYSSNSHLERIVAVIQTEWGYNLNNGGTRGTWKVRVVNADSQPSGWAPFNVQ
jgi:hypothetical protein